MSKIAAFFLAAALMGGLLLPVFVSAATVEYVESYTEWISDNVVIYNAPSGYDLEIEGPEILTPGYSVPAGEDVWSISQGYLNLSLYGNSTWANAGLFSSDFAHFQYVQNIETDGVTPVYRSIFIDFPHAIDVKGGFGFFCKWDSSYALATTVVQNPLSAVNADAYLFYYTSAGNLEKMLLDEDIKTGTPVGNISQFYKHGIELKIVALMIKYSVGQDTISALPLGQYDFYSNLYLSDIVYQNEEAETSSGSSVDLSPIETQLEDIKQQIDSSASDIVQQLEALENGLLTPPDLSEWEASQMVGAAALDEFGKYKFNTFPPVPTTNPGDNYFTSQLWQVVDSIGNIGIPFSTPALEWLCFGDSERVFRIYHFIGWFTTIFATRAFIHAISGKVKEKNNPIHGDGDD